MRWCADCTANSSTSVFPNHAQVVTSDSPGLRKTGPRLLNCGGACLRQMFAATDEILILKKSVAGAVS